MFQDLCYLINGDQPIWLVGLTEITRTLILELIETILTHYAPIFHSHNEFRYLLKERVSPLVIKLFSPGAKHSTINSNLSSGTNSNATYDSAYFPLIARLLRVVCILIRFYFSLLITECEIFLSLLIKLLEPDKPVWQRSLAIECIHKIIIHQNLIKSFCLSYDMQPHSSKILRDLTNAIRFDNKKILFAKFNFFLLLFLVHMFNHFLIVQLIHQILLLLVDKQIQLILQ